MGDATGTRKRTKEETSRVSFSNHTFGAVARRVLVDLGVRSTVFRPGPVMGRDLLPFPTGRILADVLSTTTSKQRARSRWVAEGVASLNTLAGFADVVAGEASTN